MRSFTERSCMDPRLSGALRSPFGVALSAIVLLSLSLNIWGNSWGLPNRWHPDEITARATQMVLKGSVDPDQYAYGGLHYYTVAGAAVIPAGLYAWLFDPPPDEALAPDAYAAWRDTRIAHVYILARSVSAVLAAAQVLVTYAIGSLLFGSSVGILAAMLLAVAPYFVVIAHFSTVDTAANFWYWLTVLFAILFWKRGDDRWYILAALTAGLAIGTKLDRGLVFAPLLLAHLLRRNDLRMRRLFWSALLVLASYVIVNPMLLISPFKFLDGMTRDLFLNIMREPKAGTSFGEILLYIEAGLGLPLFCSAIGGMAYAIYNFLLGRDRPEIGMLLVASLPYFLFFGSRLAPVWYVPFLFPCLVLFAAYGYINLIYFLDSRYARPAVIATAVVVGFTLLRAIAFDLQFINDSRNLAAAWIHRNVPDHASVSVGPRGPLIAEHEYRLLERPMDAQYYKFLVPWSDDLERHTLYQMVRRSLRALERYFAETLGIPMRRQPFQAWFDSPRQRLQAVATEQDQWLRDKPDYIVLVEYLEQERLSNLSAPDSQYEVAARIKYENPFGFDTSFEFVNPDVYIFRRVGPAGRG
jgi:hypothetical protein